MTIFAPFAEWLQNMLINWLSYLKDAAIWLVNQIIEAVGGLVVMLAGWLPSSDIPALFTAAGGVGATNTAYNNWLNTLCWVFPVKGFGVLLGMFMSALLAVLLGSLVLRWAKLIR